MAQPVDKHDTPDAPWLALLAKDRRPAPSPVAPHVRQSLAEKTHRIQKNPTRRENLASTAASSEDHLEVGASPARLFRAIESDEQAREEEREYETKKLHWDELALLTGIPGIGILTACLLVAEIGNVHRFISKRKLVALAVLTRIAAFSAAPAQA